MISDFVKGRKKFDYTQGIQKGIILHRSIDDFTDHHPATQEAKQFFKADYRLYAGAFVDVVYDHFLANDKNEFAVEQSLKNFATAAYQMIEANIAWLPQNFTMMFPYMKEQDWLYHYKFRQGIEKGFGGLARRALYISESATAYTIFNDRYTALHNCYNAFFPALKKYTILQLLELNNS